MKITVITLFPKMVGTFFEESIIKRAQEKGLVDIEIIDLHEFSINTYGSVDDRPYGGGAGMVLRVEPLFAALEKSHGGDPIASLQDDKKKVLLTSPKGQVYNQKKAKEYSHLDHLILIAGHYEEVDERVRDFVHEEVSLGDFVMTGGEITVAAVVDSIVRLLPGVLKKEEATQIESFFEVAVADLRQAIGEHEVITQLEQKGKQTVQLLEYPHYTRPEVFQGKQVPAVLLSGNHEEIKKWQLQEAFKQTLQKRPDLLH